MGPRQAVFRKHSRRAFSLAEILITLAIFSATVGIFVTGFGSLQNGFSHQLELPEQVQLAIRLARKWSGRLQKPVFLWYPPDHSSLQITDDDGKAVGSDEKKDPGKIELVDKTPFQFLDAKANRELPSLRIDPSGVVTPFRLAYREEKNRAFQTYKADLFSGQLTLLK